MRWSLPPSWKRSERRLFHGRWVVVNESRHMPFVAMTSSTDMTANDSIYVGGKEGRRSGTASLFPCHCQNNNVCAIPFLWEPIQVLLAVLYVFGLIDRCLDGCTRACCGVRDEAVGGVEQSVWKLVASVELYFQ